MSSRDQIRLFHSDDLDTLMEIWLSANKNGHPFIPVTYWISHFAEVRSLLPLATLFLFEGNKGVLGFIGLDESRYIEGLFVIPSAQGTGVGRSLIQFAKNHFVSLSLHVYVKNTGAVSFYEKMGFHIQNKNTHSETGEEEYFMKWRKP